MNLRRVSENLSALDSEQFFDICIIGSGFAGTVLGLSLAKRGIRTVILESGQNLRHWFFNPSIRGLAACELDSNISYPIKKSRARAIGGTSNFWTGRCERLYPSDFEKNPYTPEGATWPITYDEINPYYEQAEKTLRVRGDSLSGYHPPRRKDPPLSSRTDISSLKSMMAKVGVTVDDSLTATPRKWLRFFRVSKELLPEYVAFPHASLVSGVTVTRLFSDTSRRIVGAEAQTLEGQKKTVRAKCYVVACGGIESPRLLLLSRSEVFPNGIGNAYDRVGRGFNEHPGINMYGMIPHNWSTIMPRHKIGRSYQFYDKFRKEGLGSVLPVFIQSWIFPHHLMTFKVAKIQKRFFTFLNRIKRAQLYIGATIEQRPCDSNRVTLDKDKSDHFGNPLPCLTFNYCEQDIKTLERTRTLISQIFNTLNASDIREEEITFSRHHIGTCRMGDNPKTSVTDRNLCVHETPNLYVCGSEVFITGGAVPPVLTITALAHRLSDHLISRLQVEL